MNERIEELMSIICEGQNSIQREEIENYINNLQSKIDKVIEYIDNYEIKENIDHDIYMTLLEIEDILKEDK